MLPFLFNVNCRLDGVSIAVSGKLATMHATYTNGFADRMLESWFMLALLVAPLSIYAMVIHWLERLTQRRLVERFGWNSVLWTGWLGTPIHELSHVAMCLLFRHKIDEVALFEPDQQSGRLGYVRYSYRSQSWFETAGNFFVGIAPLLGGVVVLSLLLWLFYPQAAKLGLLTSDVSSSTNRIDDLLIQVSSVSWQAVRALFQWEQVTTFRFWLFLYLVLCVGSHSAPSRSDYQGAVRGMSVLIAGLIAITGLAAILNLPLNRALETFMTAAIPLLAVLVLAALLSMFAAITIWGITAAIPVRYSVSNKT